MEEWQILIVEDDKAVATVLEEILTEHGYCVSAIISSGEEAVVFALQCKPDLVLMDILLEGELNGITAADKIRRAVDIPIIFISGNISSGDIARSLHVKPSGYIWKPFTSEHLIRKVEMALAGHKLL